MPLSIKSLTLAEAWLVAGKVMEHATADGGRAVAVAVVDAAGRLRSFAAMDEVVPASIRLAQSKAYSAVVGQQDTSHWAAFPKNAHTVDFDMRNWTDEQFSGFTGGVVIRVGGQVIGGIGVSGRKGTRGPADALPQDNELAIYGKDLLLTLLTPHGIPEPA